MFYINHPVDVKILQSYTVGYTHNTLKPSHNTEVEPGPTIYSHGSRVKRIYENDGEKGNQGS